MSFSPGNARDYLRQLKARGVHPGLQRMTRFVAALGHPEGAAPCVHVAGTNGKGSVAAMLEAILRAAGWRTGLYTSPHLVRLGERIQVNRQPLKWEQLASYVRELAPVAEALTDATGSAEPPSYFEFMTALAFTHFTRERCDIAIIEAGMGGRLDATNVVTPEVSVITSIGHDHREFLGDSLEQIAREKAGIIKTGRPVVIGRLPPEAERVIRVVANERNAAVISLADSLGAEEKRYPSTNLEGGHQRGNAGVALLAAQALPARWRLTADVTARALQHVEWPGRWQRLRVGDRQIVLDGAHNAEGAESLERNLTRLRAETGRKPVIVAGALGRTRAEALLPVVCRHARMLHLVEPKQSRACSFAELEALIPPNSGIVITRATVADLFPAPGVCVAGDAGETVVVTGSLYLVGEALVRIDPSRGPSDDDLQDF